MGTEKLKSLWEICNFSMIIIPARFASTRFPGKPLVDIGGQSMIERVYNQCIKTNQRTIVATDDNRIYEHVQAFGGEVVLTQSDHISGTDRCAEVFKNLNLDSNEIVVNVQGDEPFIKPEQILSVIDVFKNKDAQIATLCKKISDYESLHNSNVVKLVKNEQGKTIYFSRQPIPFLRNKNPEIWHQEHQYFKHIGIYAFKGSALQKVSELTPSPLELAESLEQLRWLENDYKIYAIETEFQSPAIDTPEDLQQVLMLNIDNI
ncbi:MAG: 3-deoxy-manno-octulosonate cytidylyltransferase [Bacteroidetes bacterium]|nr:3-deoxy-manno-octulosonate cytidylyltransferase [Bacteroidota bacterium]